MQKPDPPAAASSSLTPVKILKGVLHSIKLKQVAGSVIRVNLQCARKRMDVPPQHELLAPFLTAAGAGLCGRGAGRVFFK